MTEEKTKKAAEIKVGEKVYIPWLALRRKASASWLEVRSITDLANHSGPALKFHGWLTDAPHQGVSYTFAASEEVTYRV